MSIAHGALYAFFTRHLQLLGYRGWLIGVLWMLGVLAEIGVFLLLPALFRRYALSTILIASAACGVLRFLVIAWLADWLFLLVTAQLLHAATSTHSTPRRSPATGPAAHCARWRPGGVGRRLGQASRSPSPPAQPDGPLFCLSPETSRVVSWRSST
jgi:hypothetical protein